RSAERRMQFSPPDRSARGPPLWLRSALRSSRKRELPELLVGDSRALVGVAAGGGRAVPYPCRSPTTLLPGGIRTVVAARGAETTDILHPRRAGALRLHSRSHLPVPAARCRQRDRDRPDERWSQLRCVVSAQLVGHGRQGVACCGSRSSRLVQQS